MVLQPQFLSSIPYLAPLTTDELAGVARSVSQRRYDDNEVLFSEGTPCLGLYLVIEGSVKVTRISPAGREQVLTVVGPGQTFNDVPVFDGGPSPATAIAMEPSVVGLIPMETIRELIRTRPEVVNMTLRVLAARLRGLVALVADLTHLDVTSRVAKVLVTYHGATGHQAIALNQQDLAAMVGSTREVAARALRSLEERGAIRRQRGNLEVVSADLLREASEGQEA